MKVLHATHVYDTNMFNDFIEWCRQRLPAVFQSIVHAPSPHRMNGTPFTSSVKFVHENIAAICLRPMYLLLRCLVAGAGANGLLQIIPGMLGMCAMMDSSHSFNTNALWPHLTPGAATPCIISQSLLVVLSALLESPDDHAHRHHTFHKAVTMVNGQQPAFVKQT